MITTALRAVEKAAIILKRCAKNLSRLKKAVVTVGYERFGC